MENRNLQLAGVLISKFVCSYFQVTYTEDQVVEDEEDTEKEHETGESEAEVPVTETDQESDSKDEGAGTPSVYVDQRLSAVSRFCFFFLLPCGISSTYSSSVVETNRELMS